MGRFKWSFPIGHASDVDRFPSRQTATYHGGWSALDLLPCCKIPMPGTTPPRRKCLAGCCFMLVEPPAVFCRNHWDQLSAALREGDRHVVAQSTTLDLCQ